MAFNRGKTVQIWDAAQAKALTRANLPYLVIPYLVYLTIATLIYTRLIAPRSARSPQNRLMIEHRIFLEVPRWSAVIS